MKRWTTAAAVVALAAVVSTCGATRTEVRTNSGGILDCRSETVEYEVFDRSLEARGSPSPEGMLAALSWDLGEHPGELRVESESNDEVAFVYIGADGSRLGRVVVVRVDTGWFIQRTEHCN